MSLQGKTVAFVTATEGVEQAELTGPWKAVEEAGGTPVLLTPGAEQMQAFDHLDKADRFDADADVHGADPAAYAVVVLPGGVANPDVLRQDPEAVAFVRSALAIGVPVAAICHAPWILAEADGIRGRTLTSWPSLQIDLRNAGATWVDQEVVVDTEGPGPLITSRNPDDVPAFSRALIEAAG